MRGACATPPSAPGEEGEGAKNILTRRIEKTKKISILFYNYYYYLPRARLIFVTISLPRCPFFDRVIDI